MMQGIKRELIAAAFILSALSGSVLAASDSDIVGMVGNVTKQAGAVAQMMNIAAYVAGVGFALAGILQFKAHKENPQQTPLSKPVVMLIVAAGLLFLPTVLTIAGQSLFGKTGGQKSEEVIKTNPLGT